MEEKRQVDRRPLALPEVAPLIYERNLIAVAVCELRFPTLLEYEDKPPAELQKRLRKTYPHFETAESVRLSATRPDERIRSYQFHSKDRQWTVALKPSSIALETRNYTRFEDFSARLNGVLEKSIKLLDTNFYTRVGLRFINKIEVEDGDVSGWIRSDLLGPLEEGVYGDPERCMNEIRGATAVGGYTFRHGIPNADQPLTYHLDFDFYRENVEVTETEDLLSEFSVLSFKFFHWAIGEKSLRHLGTGTPRDRS